MWGKTLMENLNESSLLPKRFFGFRLSTNHGESELTIGGADNAVFKSDTLVSVPVTGKGFWQVDLGGISRPGSAVPVGVHVSAMIDTGTDLIHVPEAIAESYFAGIPGALCWLHTGRCTGASHLYIIAGSLRSTSCSSMR